MNNSIEDEQSLEVKYEIAKNQLESFRAQAGKVRELLARKMKEYEERVTDAHKGRDEALERASKLESILQDKEEAWYSLREQLTTLRDDRLRDARLWEERDAKIKEWVRLKFVEMEKDQDALKAENSMLWRKVNGNSEEGGKVDAVAAKPQREKKAKKVVNSYEEDFGGIIDDLGKVNFNKMCPSNEEVSRKNLHRFGSEGSNSSSPCTSPQVPPRRASLAKKKPRRTGSNASLSSSSSPRGKAQNGTASKPSPLASPMTDHRKGKGPSHQPLNLFKKFRNSSNSSIDDVFNSLNDKNYTELRRSHSKNEKRSSSWRKGSEPLYYTVHEMHQGMAFQDGEKKAPVYATLRGRATKIRQVPFSGESTDSEAGREATNKSESVSSLTSNAESAPIPSPRTKKKLKTCAPYTAQNMKTETMQMAGYLTKLGGRVKNWKKRWFVLSNGKIEYYKSQNDTSRKPLGQIKLENVTEIARADKSFTFQLVTPSRTFYLTADSDVLVDEWLKVLRNTIRRFMGAQLLAKAGAENLHKGWITKVKGGSSKKMWCILNSNALVFHRKPDEVAPSSAMNLREIVNVVQVDDGNPSESDGHGATTDTRYTLMIQLVKDSHPIYLVLSSAAEFEYWKKKLNMALDQKVVEGETEFEDIVTNLMSVNGDPGSRFWRDPAIIHSRHAIIDPLTTLKGERLKDEAVKMFRSILLFSTTPISEQAIDYHIALAQDIMQMCFNHQELQSEIYCQLIKQTTKYRHQVGRFEYQAFADSMNDWTDTGQNDQTIDLNPVSDSVYFQCWTLLALCTSLFLPKLKVLWLLKMHLQKSATANSENGRYALYCQRSLERTLNNGEREAKPSRVETMSIIVRNPYFRPLPMSIPVYFINNTYQVFSFDGSTTVEEFITRINADIGIRECSQSGYALFSDNPVAQVEHCLQTDLKLCDVISKWEIAMKSLKQGRVERQRVIKLTYKNRLYFRTLSRTETEREKFLFLYDAISKIMKGDLVPSFEAAIKLASFLTQIEYGNYFDNARNLDESLERFFPLNLSEQEGVSKRALVKCFADFWSTLRGKNAHECMRLYVNIVRQIPFFGASFFEATEKFQTLSKHEEPASILIAVEEDRIAILNKSTRVPKGQHDFSAIVTFGGFKDDFMLVLQDDLDQPEKTTRLLYEMPPGKVLEITFLIASYINAVVARRGLDLEVTRTTSVSKQDGLHRIDTIQLWDMETGGKIKNKNNISTH